MTDGPRFSYEECVSVGESASRADADRLQGRIDDIISRERFLRLIGPMRVQAPGGYRPMVRTDPPIGGYFYEVWRQSTLPQSPSGRVCEYVGSFRTFAEAKAYYESVDQKLLPQVYEVFFHTDAGGVKRPMRQLRAYRKPPSEKKRIRYG